MKPDNIIALAFAAVALLMAVFPITAIAADAARFANGDLKVDGIHFSADGNVIRKLTDLSSPWTILGSDIYYLTGNIGVGTMTPAQRLSVAGAIESTSGGFKFPDGTTQTSAASVSPTGDLNITGNLYLPATTATAGSIFVGGNRFIYAFGTNNGLDNIIMGLGAGNLTMSGQNNSAYGNGALNSNTTGHNNTASGQTALNANTTGYSNTANGAASLYSNTTGYDNTANGFYTLQKNTTGYYNTASGHVALASNTSGHDNTAIGHNALTSNTTANYNTAVGVNALQYQSFSNGSVSWDTFNTAVGSYALNANNPTSASNGIYNTASGSYALFSNTTGAWNTASGSGTLRNNTTGNYNTATGLNSLNSNTTGSSNTASGNAALLYNTTGNYNTASGEGALGSNTSANYNTALGINALEAQSYSNGSVPWDSNNTAIGSYALRANNPTSASNGINNTALGYRAGYTAISGYANTYGFNNTFIGANSGPGTSNQYNNATAIGYNALVSQNNSLVLGGTGTYAVNVGIGTTTPSATLAVVNSASSNKGLTVKGAASQTANLLEWQNSSGTVLASVSSAGALNLPTNGLVVGTNQLVTSGGKVGIGKSPVYDLLDINGAVRMNDNQIYMRVNGDNAHGVGWYASGGFASGNPDGPVLYGCGGGTLGSICGGNRVALKWDNSGNVTIPGTLSKGGGSFKIDHPLDPRNKYLYHSFVESPDMMNIYNGNVTTDVNGFATVEMPAWFEALNREFRYQLTVIGQFAQAIIAREITAGSFTIQSDKPAVKVSWQITGIRKDAYAEKNRIQVEEDKPVTEKGTCMHPEACNYKGENPE